MRKRKVGEEEVLWVAIKNMISIHDTRTCTKK